jgi:hypothetical protein
MRLRQPRTTSRFVRWVAALALAGAAGRPAAAAERRIELAFPEALSTVCGVEVGGQLQVPADRRPELQGILDTAYDDIVAVYGEPMLGVSKRRVGVFFTPGTDAGMYLTHKSEGSLRLVGAMVGSLLAPGVGTTCALTADIPDHVIFIDPDMDGFRNVFLHELIHVFHDRQSYLGWYVHSWVEEGMTEAATELVVDRLRQRGVHDLEGAGVGHTAWDNLKHYDPWGYPFNGAWRGDPRFAVLGAQAFYQGSFALLAFGDKAFSMPPVIPPNVRYAAAASTWLMMAKAFSPDPASPDFLRRVNARIAERGLRALPDDRREAVAKMIGLLEEVQPGARMEGLPLRVWLLSQAILKGAPSGEDYLFLDVRDPENLRLETRPITAYALYRAVPTLLERVSDHLASAELPARDCPVELSVRDALGREVHRDFGTTDAAGAYRMSAGPALEAGAYSIRARVVGTCARIEDGYFDRHTPAGMDASTYAVVSGEAIDAATARANASLLGATVRPAQVEWKQGLRQAVSVVAADALVEALPPSARRVEAPGALGYFRAEVADPGFGLDNVLAYVPLDLRVGQRDGSLPWALRHPRFVFKPSPYTRVVWVGTSPDFSVLLSPASLPVDVGASLRIAVMLLPNGVAHGGNPLDCPLRLTVPRGGTLPTTLRTTLLADLVNLGESAPEVTIADLRVEVETGTPAGRYAVPVQAVGDSGGSCSGLVRSAVFTLDVLPPLVPVRVDAVVADASPVAPLPVPIRIVTSEADVTRTTAFERSARQGTAVRLEAPAEAAGGSLRFLGWELDHQPGRRTADNPLTVTVTAALSVTARYVSSRTTVLTIEATVDGSALPAPIPVPIRWSWAPPRGTALVGTGTTRFELRTQDGVWVALDAPARVTLGGRELEFYRWESGGSSSSATHLGHEVRGDATLVARYRSVRPETVTLTVTALCDGCATGPVAFSGLLVKVTTPPLGVYKAPFSITVPKNGAVSLTTPSSALVSGRTLRFVFWMSVTDWRALTASPTLSGLADKTETLAPVYRPY